MSPSVCPHSIIALSFPDKYHFPLHFYHLFTPVCIPRHYIWAVSIFCCFLFMIFFFKFEFIFNGRIIALQCCLGFCHTWTRISHRYPFVPLLLNLPPHPTPLGCHRAADLSSLHHSSKFPLAAWYYVWWHVCFRAPLSVHPTLFFPYCVHKSALPACVSAAACR